MFIQGLENDYYLIQNNIWIQLRSFTYNVASLELTVTNTTTNIEPISLILYPSPENKIEFNISEIVRALFPEPNHILNNNLQNMQMDFNIKYILNGQTLYELESITKRFVMGGRNKNATDEWYLSPSQELIVGKWIKFDGLNFPLFANRIMADSIVDFLPSNYYNFNLRNLCNYKLVKFLNSLGGYQYFIFESFEIKTKSKAGKIIQKTTSKLKEDNFRNLSIGVEKNIEFNARTPFEIQEVFTDLVSSLDIFLYNENGIDDETKWERLILENNTSIENNFDRVYENKINLSFSNYRTINL